jgi:hypothetical protein
MDSALRLRMIFSGRVGEKLILNLAKDGDGLLVVPSDPALSRFHQAAGPCGHEPVVAPRASAAPAITFN